MNEKKFIFFSFYLIIRKLFFVKPISPRRLWEWSKLLFFWIDIENIDKVNVVKILSIKSSKYQETRAKES